MYKQFAKIFETFRIIEPDKQEESKTDSGVPDEIRYKKYPKADGTEDAEEEDEEVMFDLAELFIYLYYLLIYK